MKSGCITCDQAIAQIKAALKRRSQKRWSVRTYRGTGYGWITVTAPPSRCLGEYRSSMQIGDQSELADLFGLEIWKVGPQGIRIAAEDDFYQEYIDRAEGREPCVVGVIDLYKG